MAEPVKKKTYPPDIEVERKQREAEQAARESEDEIVRSAVEKRFINKTPPRRGRTHSDNHAR